MYRNPVAITTERHGRKRLRSAGGFGFAAAWAAAPIYLPEMMLAAADFPIGFTQEADGLVPTAVLGLAAGRNLFVAPDGQWIGNYVPASLRRYPFILGRSQNHAELVLCIDEGSGLLSDTAGDPLFDADLKPTEIVTKALKFCTDLEAAHRATLAATAALADAGLIHPWPLKIQSEGGNSQAVEGLYRMELSELNELAGDRFLALRDKGALTIAYAHLMSLSNLRGLSRLATRMAPPPPPPPPATPQGEVPLQDLVFRF